MAKKTLKECSLDAINLADALCDLDGGLEEPVKDIFKPKDVVTAVQLRQMAYKLRVQSAIVAKHADFIEKNAKNVGEYRPAYWRMYTGLYADAVEDQMDKVLYCLGKMEQDTAKLQANPGMSFGETQSESMIEELKEIGDDIETNFRKEVEGMMD